jgi:hypothetical protein
LVSFVKGDTRPLVQPLVWPGQPKSGYLVMEQAPNLPY